MKKITILLTVLALGGCAGMATPLPDAQSSGARLFAEKCNACHALPHPKRLTAEQWRHILGVMEQRIHERGMPALTTEERKSILEYLQQHSRT